MTASRVHFLVFAALIFAVAPLSAEEPSLGEKIKNIFATPTPTPRRTKHVAHAENTPKPYAKSSPSEKTKKSPTPTPEDEETPTPKPKKKKKKAISSPSPTPTPTPTPTTPSETPTETPSPTTEEESPSPSASPKRKVATVAAQEIVDFDKNPAPVRKLLEDALALTTRNLDYKYGSADPESGGMDCSGFIYFVLEKNGLKDVPRDASGQYVWVRKAGNFRAVLSREADSFELDELAPGDLLFWTGTYSIERDPPVTHTMIYLGKEKASGKPIMVGASDGRTYEGEQQFGVSVFDFKTSSSKAAAASGTHPRFVGYARIPGLEDSQR